MTQDFDVAIVGSGFGGSLLAMVLRRLGRSVILVERGIHPRFAIGESTSPLTNLLIEQIAKRYDLPRVLPLTAWGPWQQTYPSIAGGLKRGFTYYHHKAGIPFARDPERRDQLLVAASPNDEIADTHWLRADVDHFLLREAVELGVEYSDETFLSGVEWTPGGLAVVHGDRRGQPIRMSARLVIDATGPRGFLSRTLELPDARFQDYPATQTLFSHFTGVRRTDEMDAFRVPGDPPYQPDNSALHHVFDGGWMWALRFNNGVTSAGIAVEERLGRELELNEGAPAWDRFLERYPSIAEQFEEAKPIRRFDYWPRLSYRSSRAAGPGWAMLPSAAGFVDPLFSTGITLTLLGIERLGRILDEAWGSDDIDDRLADYGAATLQEVDWTARFVGASYAGFRDFSMFAALSMFYFAAASYSEMARRLDRPELVRRFLAADRPEYAAAMASCEDAVRCGAAGPDFEARVCEAIAPLNVAGLCNPSKSNWYGVDLDDVVRSAEKLGFSPDNMRQILATTPWAKAACRIEADSSVDTV